MAALTYATAVAASTKRTQLRITSFPKSSSFVNPNKPIKILPNLTPLKSSETPPDLSAIEAAASDPLSLSITGKSLKSRLRNNETLYGIFLLSFSPTVAEISGLAGYDFAVVDMEHGPGGISDALACLRALAATRTPAILRLPESCPTWAKKALDLGPQGIMFPMIDSPKEAKKAVSYCRFPPAGIRGSAHPVVRASDYGIDEGYLSHYEEELLIMCQVESEDGVKKIEEIAAVNGVDCIQMGPLDLSASMGYLWDPGHKKVREMMRTAERGVLAGGGAYLAGFALPHDGPLDMKSRGYHMVSGTVDVGLYRSAAVEDVRRFKMSLMDGSDYDDDDRADSKDEAVWMKMASLSTDAATSTKTLKDRLNNGETLYGLFLVSFSPTLAEISGHAGYDFAVVDMEHGHGGISQALSCLHALAATQTPAILRLPENSPTWVKKALDLGPQGLMFPMIDGPDSAKQAVSYCRYPPGGVRGAAHPVVRASKYGIDEGYLSKYEKELLIMCQIESEEAVKNVKEIAAVDGMDCVMIGPLDLSASMGCLWDPGSDKVKETLRVAEEAVLGCGDAYLAGFCMPHDAPDEMRRRGYHMICGAVDVGLFRSAAVEDVNKFRLSKIVHNHNT